MLSTPYQCYWCLQWMSSSTIWNNFIHTVWTRRKAIYERIVRKYFVAFYCKFKKSTFGLLSVGHRSQWGMELIWGFYIDFDFECSFSSVASQWPLKWVADHSFMTDVFTAGWSGWGLSGRDVGAGCSSAASTQQPFTELFDRRHSRPSQPWWGTLGTPGLTILGPW